MKRFIIAATAACAISTSAFADSAIKPLNDKLAEYNLGEFSGEARILWMQDSFSDNGSSWQAGNAHSTTGSLKLNYQSPEIGGLRLGASYINAGVFESGGGKLDGGFTGNDFGQRGDYWLANGQLNVLNEFYLNYNFKGLGLEKTDLRVGRQVLGSTSGAWQGLDFLVKKDIRHKAQAIEGIVLTSQDIENLSLSIGHIEKFSNWGWTDKDGDGFDDVEDAYLRSFGNSYLGYGLEGSLNTKGVQFVSATCTGFENLALTAYDFYANDLMNTLGLKAVYDICPGAISLKAHYVHQNTIGALDNYIEDEGYDSSKTDLLDLSITSKVGSMDIETGYMTIMGETDDTHLEDFIAPFDFFAVPCDQLLVYTDSFKAGADSYYVQGRGMITDKLFLLAMYTYTNHDNSRVQFDAQEVDVILSYNVTENFSISTLGALGWRSGENGGRSGQASDLRLFASYKF